MMITTLSYEILDGMSKLVQTKRYSDGSITKYTINPVTGLPDEFISDSEESEESSEPDDNPYSPFNYEDEINIPF